MIYFTADLHLGHNAILHMQNRPFADVDEMNETLIQNINATVRKNDHLYLLGDLSYRISAEETDAFMRRVNGHKHLILGNHDKRDGRGDSIYDASIYEEIRDYQKIRVPEYGEYSLILFHYPMLTWHKWRSGGIHLHGHIHATRDYNEKNIADGIRRYDVGVDANDYYPVSVVTVMEWARRTGMPHSSDYHTDSD